MSEQVLGFKKQKMICNYCDKLGEPKMLTFLCKDCADMPIFNKKDKIKLVPVVSVEELEAFCKTEMGMALGEAQRVFIKGRELKYGLDKQMLLEKEAKADGRAKAFKDLLKFVNKKKTVRLQVAKGEK